MTLPTSMMTTPSGPVEYRLTGRGERTVLIMHGAHLSAGAARVGERDFSTAGARVLVVSRPGYGRTPVSSGRTRETFSDSVASLCRQLGITQLAAAVGMSHGGPSAVTFAVRHPALVERLILQSSLSSVPWPDLTTRVTSMLAMNGITQGFSWFTIQHTLLLHRDLGLALMLGALSTKSGVAVVEDFSERERLEVAAMFLRMRSGQGYMHDLLQPVDPALEAAVPHPTLVLASPYDGAVPLAHARRLSAAIPDARLVVTQALSHLIWFGCAAELVRDEVHAHLERPGLASADRARAAPPTKAQPSKARPSKARPSPAQPISAAGGPAPLGPARIASSG